MNTFRTPGDDDIAHEVSGPTLSRERFWAWWSLRYKKTLTTMIVGCGLCFVGWLVYLSPVPMLMILSIIFGFAALGGILFHLVEGAPTSLFYDKNLDETSAKARQFTFIVFAIMGVAAVSIISGVGSNMIRNADLAEHRGFDNCFVK